MNNLGEIFKKEENETINQVIMFYCLVLLSIGLPSSRFLVSVAQILIVINWVAEGSIKRKMKDFVSNKPVFFFCSTYFVFVIGLLWSGDLAHGLDFDLKNKLPFLTFPLVLATSIPLSRKRVLALPLFFSSAVFVVSIIGAYIFFTNQYVDTRLLSPFTVHIHYGLMVLFAIFILPWSMKNLNVGKFWMFIALIVSGWLLVFLFLLSSLIVFASLGVVVVYLFVKLFFDRKEITFKAIIASGFLIMVVASLLILRMIVTPLFSINDEFPQNTHKITEYGSKYDFKLDWSQRENGYLVGAYIAEDELREAWNEISSFDFDGLDINGNEIKATIYRFFASRGLKKDRLSLSQLTDTEIEAIENGVANHLYLKWPRFMGRIHQSLWEIQQYYLTGNPNGHSLSQRFELWRASAYAIQKYPLFGWGTGGVLKGLEYGLDKMNSQLQNRMMRPHNQFLVFIMMVGVVGTLLIILAITNFLVKTKALRFFPARILALIIFVAMLGDVPFDYQMGINFSLFFLMYFAIIYPQIVSSEQVA